MNLISMLSGAARVVQCIGEGLQSESTKRKKYITDAAAESEKFYDEQRKANIARQVEYNRNLTEEDREYIRANQLRRYAELMQIKAADEQQP